MLRSHSQEPTRRQPLIIVLCCHQRPLIFLSGEHHENTSAPVSGGSVHANAHDSYLCGRDRYWRQDTTPTTARLSDRNNFRRDPAWAERWRRLRISVNGGHHPPTVANDVVGFLAVCPVIDSPSLSRQTHYGRRFRVCLAWCPWEAGEKNERAESKPDVCEKSTDFFLHCSWK